MVARTNPDCLPYMECTDPICVPTGDPCDPSSVWCDFAEGVETRLDELDAVVARTADTVPMAMVARSVPLFHSVAVTSGTFVEFTEAVIDTDGMVNLDTYALGFQIQRPGLYELVCYGIGVTNTAGSDLSINFSYGFSPSGSGVNGITINSISANFQANVDDIIVTLQAQLVLALEAGQNASLTITTGGDVADSVTFSYIMISATWIGDIPS